MLYSHRELPFAPSRDGLILDLCAGKRVLHVGAADSPYSAEKLASGLLLQVELARVASRLVGIDSDREAVELLRRAGVPDLTHADLESFEDPGLEPELIVFGETLEHLDNPGHGLDVLVGGMRAETRLLISTPNLTSLYNAWQAVRRRETVHPDHRVGFTYGLLKQLCEAHGLELERFWFTFLDRERTDWKERLWRRVSRRLPGLSETLLALCRRSTP